MGVDYEGEDVQYDIDPSILQDDSGLDVRLVTINSGAVDNSSGASSELSPGLMLGKLSSKDAFVHFDGGASDGSERPAFAVVLAESVDVSGGDVQEVAVIYEGNVTNLYFEGTATDPSQISRLNTFEV